MAEEGDEERDAQRSRAQRIRDRIRSLGGKKRGARVPNPPKSPREFVEDKMRDLDRSRGSKDEGAE